MNRKSVKFSFAVRTCAVMAVIFILINIAMTFMYAEKYRKDMIHDIKAMTGYLMSDLRECVGVDKDSAAYKDGLNLAQANAILQYYKIKKLSSFEKRGIDIDISLYRIDTDDGGVIGSYEKALAGTTVIIGKPYSHANYIIVPADVFSEEDALQLDKVINEAEDFFISSSEGYRNGHFYYPKTMMAGDFLNNIKLRSDRPDGGNLVSFDDASPLIIMPDGTMKGEPAEEYPSLNAESKTGDISNLYSYSESWSIGEFTYEDTEALCSERYALHVYSKGKQIAYAFSHLKKFYGSIGFIFILMTIVLIKTNNRLIEKRMETESSRRRMMDSMTHEMKTPLSVIRNYGELLMEEDNEEKRTKFTRNIIDEADSLNEAIVSMLELSKMEDGTYPMELSSVSINEVLQKELKRKNVLLESKGLSVEADVDDKERVLVDEKLVVSIVSNFLSNGISHAIKGSKLTVTIKTDKTGAYIAVRNRGRNIPEQELGMIWNMFYGKRDADKEGSGLGLAIVRNACLMHNGSYGCTNEEDGVTFWAKIQSMGDSIRQAELAAGPVLGVTGKNRLKGLPYIIAGVAIFSIAIGGNGVVLCDKLLFLFSYDEISPWFYQIEDAISILVGSIFMFLGAFTVSKQGRVPKDTLLLTVELMICTAIEAVFSFWLIVLRKGELDFELSPGIYFVSAVSEVLIIVLFFVVIVRVFEQCIRLASDFGNSRWKKICRTGMYIFMILYPVWMLIEVLCAIVPMPSLLYEMVMSGSLGYLPICLIPIIIWGKTYARSGKL